MKRCVFLRSVLVYTSAAHLTPPWTDVQKSTKCTLVEFHILRHACMQRLLDLLQNSTTIYRIILIFAHIYTNLCLGGIAKLHAILAKVVSLHFLVAYACVKFLPFFCRSRQNCRFDFDRFWRKNWLLEPSIFVATFAQILKLWNWILDFCLFLFLPLKIPIESLDLYFEFNSGRIKRFFYCPSTSQSIDRSIEAQSRNQSNEGRSDHRERANERSGEIIWSIFVPRYLYCTLSNKDDFTQTD